MGGINPISVGFKFPQTLKINTQVGKTTENEKGGDNTQVSKGNILPSPPGDPVPNPPGPWNPKLPRPPIPPKPEPKRYDLPARYKPGDPIVFGDSWKTQTPKPGTWYKDGGQWLRWGDRIY